MEQYRGEWNSTEGRGHKDFKKGGKLGQGVGVLKTGGAATTLQTMALVCDNITTSLTTSHNLTWWDKRLM